jgi:hypothetical protein
MAWENVPNALNSGAEKGDDFKAIIESIVRIADDKIVVPKPKKWLDKGIVLGNGFSLAWCVLDSRKFVRSGENASSRRQRLPLSRILQDNVPKKYYLSPIACRGILNRAKRRGKTLPEILKTTLEKQAELATEATI